MTAEQISLAVVDDHPLFREGVIRSLTEMDEFKIVGEGSNRDDALRIAAEHRPDILLLDISMPGGGLEAVPLILEQVPAQKIVMLTVSEAGDDVMTALRSGAKGYVLKGVGSRALADIIRTVAAGDSYVAPTLSARLISQTGSGARANPFVALTEREPGSARAGICRVKQQAYWAETGFARKDDKTSHDTDLYQARREQPDGSRDGIS
ncbi:UNVERIFIED_ORG: two-component system nitrate/nitrite response regulator NarL [Rhizobium sp. SORGH_AS285]|nr:two-component system nitrate/nitrite response regulator NarL [Rhizobium sp. SORGH_AS_0285]